MGAKKYQFLLRVRESDDSQFKRVNQLLMPPDDEAVARFSTQLRDSSTCQLTASTLFANYRHKQPENVKDNIRKGTY